VAAQMRVRFPRISSDPCAAFRPAWNVWCTSRRPRRVARECERCSVWCTLQSRFLVLPNVDARGRLTDDGLIGGRRCCPGRLVHSHRSCGPVLPR
jgi:hypothetical protein